MKDVVAIQHALYHGLRGCTLFDDFNIVLARQLAAQSELEMDSVWLTPGPSGKKGLGLLVQMPTLNFPKANSLMREREFAIGIFEERNLNFTPNEGTMTTAEDVGDLLVDFLWNWTLWRTSGLILQDKALVPDERYPGIVGFQARVTLRQERAPTARVARPTLSGTADAVTISADPGANVFYTVDGFSFPGPTNTGAFTEETAAIPYTGPFSVPAGTWVQAAAWIDGQLPSDIAARRFDN